MTRVLTASLLVALSLALIPQLAVAATRPDIILILTDDQRFDTMRYLPATNAALPIRYTKAFVSNPMCCPSRTAILSGLYSHDSGVWSNLGAFGGYDAYARWQAEGGVSISQALQSGGYQTGLYGKFMNHWDGSSVPGWSEFYADHQAATDGNSAPYYGYTLSGWNAAGAVQEPHGSDPADYSTDVISGHVVDAITAAPADVPMFTYYAPNAPHSSLGAPPIPGPLDADAPVTIRKLGENFNEADVSDKPAWVQRLHPIGEDFERLWLTQAARSLLGVDRSVRTILDAQEARDPGLANTVVIYTSDNGFANGAHRWHSKGVPYEESIRVPFRAWYAGATATTVTALTTNLDVAPTIAAAAGVEFATNGDGVSLLNGPPQRTSFVIEGGTGSKSRKFCGVRTATAVFVKYNTDEREYYDLTKDPHQMTNRPNNAAVPAMRALAVAGCDPLPPLWPRSSL